jgi:hypothetical protein
MTTLAEGLDGWSCGGHRRLADHNRKLSRHTLITCMTVAPRQAAPLLSELHRDLPAHTNVNWL